MSSPHRPARSPRRPAGSPRRPTRSPALAAADLHPEQNAPSPTKTTVAIARRSPRFATTTGKSTALPRACHGRRMMKSTDDDDSDFVSEDSPPPNKGRRPQGDPDEPVASRTRRGRTVARYADTLKSDDFQSEEDDIPPLPKKKQIKPDAAPKDAGSKEDPEHFKHRFSVHRIRDIVPFLDDDQKQWAHESGFGALLNMSDFSLPIKLVKWVMRHTDPLLKEFRLKNRVIAFDRDLVCKIFGFENGTVPVKLSCNPDEFEAFLELRNVFKVGHRAKISKCIEVVKGAHEKDAFIRAFVMIAISSVFCPGTDNGVPTKYLHSLPNKSQIKTFDWAGHIIDVLREYVKKYQALPPEALESDHQVGSCLAILAIAYMDHLDISADRSAHKINYSTPWICYVTNDDFKFVSMVDRSRLELHGYGKLSFRTITPYSTPPPSVEIPPQPSVEPTAFQHTEDVANPMPSLDDWMQEPSTSTKTDAKHSTDALPEEFQILLAEQSSLYQRDIDQLTQSVANDLKEKGKTALSKHCTELAVNMLNLKKRSDESRNVEVAFRSLNLSSDPATTSVKVQHTPSEDKADDTPINFSTSTSDHTHTSSPDTHGLVTETIINECSKQQSMPSKIIGADAQNQDPPSPAHLSDNEMPPPHTSIAADSNTTKASADAQNQDPPSPAYSSDKEVPPPHTSTAADSNTSYVDDVPSFDLFEPRCPEFSFVYGDGPSSVTIAMDAISGSASSKKGVPAVQIINPNMPAFDITPIQSRPPACVVYDSTPIPNNPLIPSGIPMSPKSPGAALETPIIIGTSPIVASFSKKEGSSTIEKKNRRKRAAVSMNPGQKPKRIKLDNETKAACMKFLGHRFLKSGFKEGSAQNPPPFIDIVGFHVSYDEFYESLKPRGLVHNNLMALWTYQYNLGHRDDYNNKKEPLKKFAFSPNSTDYLIVEHSTFNTATFKHTLIKLNKTWSISNMDLV